MTTIAKSGYGTFEDDANYAAAGLRMTYVVVSSVWGVVSTWTLKARSLLEAVRKASEELSDRSYAGYIISVRQVDAYDSLKEYGCLGPLHAARSR